MVLQGESEFKRWFDTNVFDIPKIVKDEFIMITDFELLMQTFYLGQDKRDSSSVNSSYFKKDDFISMLCYMGGCCDTESNSRYLLIKKELDELKKKEKDLVKKTKLIKKMGDEVKYVSEFADKEEFKKKMAEIQELVKLQSILKCKRNKLFVRITKNLKIIDEINSIKRNIPEGRLICSQCGSTDIVYSYNKDITFNISNDEMKSNIVKNIFRLNEDLNAQIKETENDMSRITNELQELLRKKDINPINIILFKDDIEFDLDFENELLKIESELTDKKSSMDEIVNEIEKNKDKEKEITDSIVRKVTEYYQLFDKDENVKVDDIFTKSNEIYSGSENTIFFLSRLFAFENILNHKFPIIIDGFREGEVSSPTEKKILDCFKGLSKQIILTATLKDEEYHKYDNDNLISRYDFSNVNSKHLLDIRYVDGLKTKIDSFNLSFYSHNN